MKLKHTLIIGMSLGCLAGIASAQGGPPGGPPPGAGGEGGNRIGEFLKRADTNADGKISKEEFVEFSKKEAEERFAKIDANGDGSADEGEVSKIGEIMRNALRSRAGGEGQGGPGGQGGGFRRPGGEGGEGGFRRPPAPEGAPQGGPPPGGPDGPPGAVGGPPGGPGGPPGQGGPGGFGRRPQINPEEMFGKMDANKDGAVDVSEFSAPQTAEIEARFKRVDENGDGKITLEELKSGVEKMGSQGGRGGPGGPPGQGGPGGFRRGPGAPGGEGGPGGGFRRPPGGGGEGGTGRPRPEGDAPKKEGV